MTMEIRRLTGAPLPVSPPVRGSMVSRGNSRAARPIVVSTTACVSARGTLASGTCTVASTTLSGSDQNIIATVGLAVRCPSRSVCPFHGSPARAKAALFTGAVARPETVPSRASRTAATMAS